MSRADLDRVKAYIRAALILAEKGETAVLPEVPRLAMERIEGGIQRDIEPAVPAAVVPRRI